MPAEMHIKIVVMTEDPSLCSEHCHWFGGPLSAHCTLFDVHLRPSPLDTPIYPGESAYSYYRCPLCVTAAVWSRGDIGVAV